MEPKTMPYPQGVAVVPADSMEQKARRAAETHAEVTRDIAKLGKLKLFFKATEAGELVKVIAKRAKALTRAAELSKTFRMVRLDETLKRKVVVADRWTGMEREVSVPLIFTSRLPAKAKRSYTVVVKQNEPRERGNLLTPRRVWVPRWRRGRPQRFTVSAVVPVPQDAALEALQKHAGKFDHTEVWWVPKDVQVREVRPRVADPIVVGVVEAPRKNREPERFCFELYRWEQPDLEKPYFAHEAY